MADKKHRSQAPASGYNTKDQLEALSNLADARIVADPEIGTQPTRIEAEIARAAKLKNDDAEQDITLKRMALNRLFKFLTAETIIIFVFAYLQGTHAFNFHLEEWSFKILVTATILQITAMLSVAVSYLFPKNRS